MAERNIYEDEELLAQYLAFHYPDNTDYCPWQGAPVAAIGFAQRVAELALRHAGRQAGDGAQALDLGCAVGGTALELTRVFDEVLGIDLSENFIRHATAVASRELSEYALRIEGDVRVTRRIVGSCAWRREHVSFRVGDACKLQPWPGRFDLVVMANLLCRTPDPQAVLAQASQLVRPGGILVVTTPCTWLEQFTPREKWLCNGEGGTLGGLTRCLKANFFMRERTDMPFLIREHARKYQWSVAEATVWERTTS